MITPKNQQSGHAAMVQVFCICGWMTEMLYDGTLICKNPTCAERWKRYQVSVELKEVNQKTGRA